MEGDDQIRALTVGEILKSMYRICSLAKRAQL